MARTAEEIEQLYRRRQRTQGVLQQKMREMANLVNGDVVIPLPELNESSKPAVVNLAKQGINQMAMRVASLEPSIYVPAIEAGRREDAMRSAELRRKVWVSWWAENNVMLKLRRRARWYYGYAQAPVMIAPDFDRKIPKWIIRSPLNTYAAERTDDPDEMRPSDVIFAVTQTVGFVRSRWPEVARAYLGPKIPDDAKVEVLEYVDCDEVHMVCSMREIKGSELGWDQYQYSLQAKGPQAVTLEVVQNRVGEPLVIVPGAITLDKRVSQFDGLIGMYYAQAELDALARIARKKGVFAEEWLVAKDDQTMPEIVEEADPMQGIVGIVRGGALQKMNPDTLLATDTGTDRLERNQRTEASVPADFGGEAGSNVRTGARANALNQSSVSPALQESQEVFGLSMQFENRLAALTDKAYWGPQQKWVYINWKGDADGSLKYVPNKLWTTTRHTVEFPLPGTDSQSLGMEGLQRVGAGVLSKFSWMMMDPLVRDATRERDAIIYERLNDALLTSIETMAAHPQGMPLPDLARIAELIYDDKKTIIEAVKVAQDEAQKRQATQATPQPDQPMGQPAPGQMPGLTIPGQGAEQLPPQIGPVPPSLDNLKMLMRSLKATG